MVQLLNQLKQKFFDNDMPKLFPGVGQWIFVESTLSKGGIKLMVPAKIVAIKKRVVTVESKNPFPGNCLKEIKIFFPRKFQKKVKNKVVIERRRFVTESIIKKRKTDNNIIIKLTDGIIDKANQREYERLPYNDTYNISLNPKVLKGKDKKTVVFNDLMSNFFSSFKLIDVAPGGFCGTCPKVSSKFIKESIKMNMILCFDKRSNYKFFNKLLKTTTQKIEIQLVVRVLRKFEYDNNKKRWKIILELAGDVNPKEFILAELNKIRLSDAAVIEAKNSTGEKSVVKTLKWWDKEEKAAANQN